MADYENYLSLVVKPNEPYEIDGLHFQNNSGHDYHIFLKRLDGMDNTMFGGKAIDITYDLVDCVNDGSDCVDCDCIDCCNRRLRND